MHARNAERLALGRATLQYNGKWPFVRVLGMQEACAVAFSLANLAAHASGLRRSWSALRAAGRRRAVWRDSRCSLDARASDGGVAILEEAADGFCSVRGRPMRALPGEPGRPPLRPRSTARADHQRGPAAEGMGDPVPEGHRPVQLLRGFVLFAQLL